MQGAWLLQLVCLCAIVSPTYQFSLIPIRNSRTGARATPATAAKRDLEEQVLPELSARRARAKAKRTQAQGTWIRQKQLITCKSLDELNHQLEDVGEELHNLDVKCAAGQDHPQDHPILQTLWQRAKEGSKPSQRSDSVKLGLAIEGGGMRGCVSAGMVTCLHHLGLADSFDAVYGSSAGCLVGAYFISRQVNGTAVYHDVLPEAGLRFMDKSKLAAALGLDFSLFRLDWWNLRLKALAERKKPAKPVDATSGKNVGVFNLDFLMNSVISHHWPLDWEAFWANNRAQPLNVVVSGLLTMDSHTLTSSKGHFESLPELARCMRASMLVPGLTGPLITLPNGFNPPRSHTDSHTDKHTGSRSSSSSSSSDVAQVSDTSAAASLLTAANPALAAVDFEYEEGHQPFADALIFEPMPYRSAAADGCTHIVTLRTRPDGEQVLGKKAGVYEKRIARKYFEEFHTMPKVSEHLIQLRHWRTYAEDVLALAQGSRTRAPVPVPQGGAGAGKEAYLLAVAPREGTPEVHQLEMRRRSLLLGCRSGFEAAYDALATPEQRAAESPAAAAARVLPDSILDTPVDFEQQFWEQGIFILPASMKTAATATDSDPTAAAAAAAAAGIAEAGVESSSDAAATAVRGPPARLSSTAISAAAFSAVTPRSPAAAATAASSTNELVAAAGGSGKGTKRAQLRKWLRQARGTEPRS